VIKPEHLTLGEVITALSAHDPDKRLKVGFRRPHSWRGDYSELAFEAAENVTVRDMLDEAVTAVGTTFQGWKGGDYVMTENTFVWLVREEGTSDGETVGALLLNLMLANVVEDESGMLPDQDKAPRDAMRDALRASDDGTRGRDLSWDFLLRAAAKRVETIDQCGDEMRHELAQLADALGVRWGDKRCTWKNLINEVRVLKAAPRG
jgi:hypothetical protein